MSLRSIASIGIKSTGRVLGIFLSQFSKKQRGFQTANLLESTREAFQEQENKD